MTSASRTQRRSRPWAPLLVWCLLAVSLGGCSYLFYPRADTYLRQAEEPTAAGTITNLVGMLQASVQAARSPNYQQAMDDLHNQLHALDEAYCRLNKDQSDARAYSKATTLRKELWTIFKPLWWQRDTPAVRQAHLDLFDTRLQEVREVVQALKG